MNRQEVRHRAGRTKQALGIMALAFAIAAAAQLFPDLIPAGLSMLALAVLLGSGAVAVAYIWSLT